MTAMVCIVHKWVPFMEVNGKMIVRCTKCGLKMDHSA